jgi:hypothetical protein
MNRGLVALRPCLLSGLLLSTLAKIHARFALTRKLGYLPNVPATGRRQSVLQPMGERPGGVRDDRQKARFIESFGLQNCLTHRI